MVRFPIPTEELTRFRQQLPSTKPKRPYAFIFGHGLWNDLDLQATLNWLDSILEATSSAAPWLSTPSQKVLDQSSQKRESRSNNELGGTPRPRANGQRRHKKSHAFWPRLFLTPNAAGKGKPDEWLVSQGNKALTIFEEAVGREVARRGLEHLGTWNMSIQANKYDGV